MAKRQTIKNNPLDSVSSNSIQESSASIESLLMGTSRESKGVSARPSKPEKTPVSHGNKRNDQADQKKPSVKRDDLSRGERKRDSPVLLVPSAQKPTVSAPQDSLDQRVTQLEEDNQMQNILIGIIVAPLALLALLGMAPPL